MESAEFNTATNLPARVLGTSVHYDLRCRIEALIQSTQREVFSLFAKRLTDEATVRDLTQDTFVLVWAKRNQLDLSQDGRAWVLTIARNVLNSHFRSSRAKKRGHPLSLDQARTKIDDDAAPDEPVDRRCADPIDRIILNESISKMDLAADRLCGSETGTRLVSVPNNVDCRSIRIAADYFGE